MQLYQIDNIALKLIHAWVFWRLRRGSRCGCIKRRWEGGRCGLERLAARCRNEANEQTPMLPVLYKVYRKQREQFFLFCECLLSATLQLSPCLANRHF